MRLVIDEIRGKNVNDALSYLQFSKKHAARQIAESLPVLSRRGLGFRIGHAHELNNLNL